MFNPQGAFQDSTDRNTRFKAKSMVQCFGEGVKHQPLNLMALGLKSRRNGCLCLYSACLAAVSIVVSILYTSLRSEHETLKPSSVKLHVLTVLLVSLSGSRCCLGWKTWSSSINHGIFPVLH